MEADVAEDFFLCVDKKKLLESDTPLFYQYFIE